MLGKGPVIYISDINLLGTYAGFVEKASEKGFVHIQYYQMNKWIPKKITHPVAIRKEAINTLDATKDYPGVEPVIKFVHTGESGSLVNNILDTANLKLIGELREKIRKLQMQVASSKQNEEDARSGVSKTISSMKNVNRQERTGFGDSLFHNARFPQQPEERKQNYDEFDEL